MIALTVPPDAAHAQGVRQEKDVLFLQWTPTLPKQVALPGPAGTPFSRVVVDQTSGVICMPSVPDLRARLLDHVRGKTAAELRQIVASEASIPNTERAARLLTVFGQFISPTLLAQAGNRLEPRPADLIGARLTSAQVNELSLGRPVTVTLGASTGVCAGPDVLESWIAEGKRVITAIAVALERGVGGTPATTAR